MSVLRTCLISGVKHNTPGQYKTGITKVKNGLRNSPLVWVDVNW
jgi:hypothetical protein